MYVELISHPCHLLKFGVDTPGVDICCVFIVDGGVYRSLQMIWELVVFREETLIVGVLL